MYQLLACSLKKVFEVSPEFGEVLEAGFDLYDITSCESQTNFTHSVRSLKLGVGRLNQIPSCELAYEIQSLLLFNAKLECKVGMSGWYCVHSLVFDFNKKKKEGLSLATKTTQNHETRRLGLIESVICNTVVCEAAYAP